jgi:hypothetical protein
MGAKKRHRAETRMALSVGGGAGGIRTLDTVNRIPDFESGAFDHSATAPEFGSRGAKPVILAPARTSSPGSYIRGSPRSFTMIVLPAGGALICATWRVPRKS